MKKIFGVSCILSLFFLLPGQTNAMPWSWDMFDQPSHKAQEGKIIAQPEGTVPTTGKPLHIKERELAEKLVNPVQSTEKSVERGKERYAIYCATCHGDSGKGDGLVGQKFAPPTDLTDEYVQEKPDGDIYYTITYGGLAIMPSYGDSLAYKDRWHIVNYIKDAFKQ